MMTKDEQIKGLTTAHAYVDFATVLSSFKRSHRPSEDEHEDDDERSGRRRIQMKMQMGSQAIRVGLNPTPNR